MKPSNRDMAGITIGIELVLSLVVPGAAGHWADQKFHTTPWLMYLGCALGLAAGFRSLFRFASNPDTPPRDGPREPPKDP